jgi:hypothetical protein
VCPGFASEPSKFYNVLNQKAAKRLRAGQTDCQKLERPLARRYEKLFKWLLGVAAVATAIGVALSFSPGSLRPHRLQTAHETLLYYFAQEIGEPALCDQISWAVHQRYNIFFAAGGASYFRSDCYERTAEARHDASVCWKVRPLIDFDPISPGYSALACRRRTLQRYSSGIGLDNIMLNRTFKRLGYDIDHLYLEGVIEPAVKTEDVYRSLEQNPAAIGRAQHQLTAAPSPALVGDDVSYLADFAAIGTADPKWCGYIPAGQALDRQQAPFRDWCFFTVAKNTQDVRICERMTPATAEPKVIDAESHGMLPDIAEQLSLHAQCGAIERDIALGTHLRYGPELPVDPRQTQRLIAALGVALPLASNWPPSEIAAYYQRFLFSLDPSYRDEVHNAARARLLRKLLALPTDD